MKRTVSNETSKMMSASRRSSEPFGAVPTESSRRSTLDRLRMDEVLDGGVENRVFFGSAHLQAVLGRAEMKWMAVELRFAPVDGPSPTDRRYVVSGIGYQVEELGLSTFVLSGEYYENGNSGYFHRFMSSTYEAFATYYPDEYPTQPSDIYYFQFNVVEGALQVRLLEEGNRGQLQVLGCRDLKDHTPPGEAWKFQVPFGPVPTERAPPPVAQLPVRSEAAWRAMEQEAFHILHYEPALQRRVDPRFIDASTWFDPTFTLPIICSAPRPAYSLPPPAAEAHSGTEVVYLPTAAAAPPAAPTIKSRPFEEATMSLFQRIMYCFRRRHEVMHRNKGLDHSSFIDGHRAPAGLPIVVLKDAPGYDVVTSGAQASQAPPAAAATAPVRAPVPATATATAAAPAAAAAPARSGLAVSMSAPRAPLASASRTGASRAGLPRAGPPPAAAPPRSKSKRLHSPPTEVLDPLDSFSLDDGYKLDASPPAAAATAAPVPVPAAAAAGAAPAAVPAAAAAAAPAQRASVPVLQEITVSSANTPVFVSSGRAPTKRKAPAAADCRDSRGFYTSTRNPSGGPPPQPLSQSAMALLGVHSQRGPTSRPGTPAITPSQPPPTPENVRIARQMQMQQAQAASSTNRANYYSRYR